MPKAKKSGASSKGRCVFKIDVSPDAVEKMNDIVASIGITHIAMASKLIKWFADQPDEIKAAIVGGFKLDGIANDAGKRFLQLIAEKH
jgi:hypothetical protein